MQMFEANNIRDIEKGLFFAYNQQGASFATPRNEGLSLEPDVKGLQVQVHNSFVVFGRENFDIGDELLGDFLKRPIRLSSPMSSPRVKARHNTLVRTASANNICDDNVRPIQDLKGIHAKLLNRFATSSIRVEEVVVTEGLDSIDVQLIDRLVKDHKGCTKQIRKHEPQPKSSAKYNLCSHNVKSN